MRDIFSYGLRYWASSSGISNFYIHECKSEKIAGQDRLHSWLAKKSDHRWLKCSFQPQVCVEKIFTRRWKLETYFPIPSRALRKKSERRKSESKSPTSKSPTATSPKIQKVRLCNKSYSKNSDHKAKSPNFRFQKLSFFGEIWTKYKSGKLRQPGKLGQPAVLHRSYLMVPNS